MQSPTAIGNQFRLRELPAFLALKAPKSPVSICRIRSGPILERTLPPPRENAYSLHVFMASVPRADQWLDNVYFQRPAVTVGQSLLFHWGQQPSVVSNMPFDVIRFGISQDALEDVAHENGLNRIEELRLQNSGVDDAVSVWPGPSAGSGDRSTRTGQRSFRRSHCNGILRPCRGHLRASSGKRTFEIVRARSLAASQGEGQHLLEYRGRPFPGQPGAGVRIVAQPVFQSLQTKHWHDAPSVVDREKDRTREGTPYGLATWIWRKWALPAAFTTKVTSPAFSRKAKGTHTGKWRRLNRS